MCLFHDLKWSNLVENRFINFGENSTSNETTGRNCTVESNSSVTRRVLAEIIYVIYFEVWAIIALEYKLEG